jgi:hypothetical protein
LNSLEYWSTGVKVPCQPNTVFINVLGIFEQHPSQEWTKISMSKTETGINGPLLF